MSTSGAFVLQNAAAELADVFRGLAIEQKAQMESSTAPDFQELLRRFEFPLLQYATRITGDRERARDVVQETFVQLQRSHREQVDHAPAKWLFTVCRNRALNVCRKERRLTFLDDEILEARQTADPGPAEQLEQKEAGGFLLRIIGTLPPRQQEVLQLKFQNDLSYQEIGEITNLSVSNVGVMIHNALKTLRKRYGNASRDFIPFPSRTTT
ncbi:MAG: sigma-70 family RNA polymerase sigma factor [Verrucomicrobiota bacterium]|nr:sigma-70 family RNA polymerase sigma factor [Verrucomicrobiota bacterium]